MMNIFWTMRWDNKIKLIGCFQFLCMIFYYIQFSKMLRESAWKKQQSILQQDANNLSILKKEINKQSEIDATVQLSISQKIETLKQNATILAKKLQNEKHKNVQLQTIISHLRNIIQKDKIEQASFRDSNSFESLTGLENRYKKLQYDLGQLNGKTNRITENVDNKKIKINQNRTERVIDSGIFRNIEKQLIESELKFKKLLIEKIKYQKQYQKLLHNYEGLKAHAETYTQQKQSNKLKSVNTDTSLLVGEGKVAKKFTNLQLSRQLNGKVRTMTKIQQQNEYEQQKKIIIIKKLLSQTRLDNCEQLLNIFVNIQEINDKYFNEMVLLTDQSNQIQKYLNQFNLIRKQNKFHFYQNKKIISKNQGLKWQANKINNIINQIISQTENQMTQISNFFNDNNFKKFLQFFGLKEYKAKEGQSHFENLKDILQDLQTNMSEILSKQNTAKEDKVNETSRSNQHQRLQELMSRVRKSDENLKVMKKQEFQDEYHKILKSSNSKSSLIKNQHKRQSNANNKK